MEEIKTYCTLLFTLILVPSNSAKHFYHAGTLFLASTLLIRTFNSALTGL